MELREVEKKEVDVYISEVQNYSWYDCVSKWQWKKLFSRIAEAFILLVNTILTAVENPSKNIGWHTEFFYVFFFCVVFQL